MSHFEFEDDDLMTDDSILAASMRNQTNYTPDGKAMALKTSAATSPTPMKSLTTWDESSIMQNMATNKSVGVALDTFNQPLSADAAAIMQSEGGYETLLGSRAKYAPSDILREGTTGLNTANDVVGGALGDTGVGNYPPPPAGEFYTTDEVRAIWGNRCADASELASFTWWSGPTYSVRAETVPVWTIINQIFQKYNYSVRPEETGGGAYNCRAITGGTELSLHAFGIACDINPTANPYGGTLVSDMPSGMIAEIEAIKTRNSGMQVVRWGGRYETNKDAMHFEVMCTPAQLAEGFNLPGGSSTGGSSGRGTPSSGTGNRGNRVQ